MPFGDGTGPRGVGPRTGRGMGVCPGSGFGPGIGFCRGRGLGRGFGRGYFAAGFKGGQQITKEEQLSELKAYETRLSAELEGIKKRLSDLEK